MQKSDSKKNKILVVVAHPDDEVLGAGGTIAKHSQNNDEVFVLILGTGINARCKKGHENKDEVNKLHKDAIESSRCLGVKETFFSDFSDNRFDSHNLLDIIEKVDKYINEIQPNIIYTNHYNDLNIDHRLTFQAVLTAARPLGSSVKRLLSFEIPSSTEWNYPCSFNPNVFIDIENTLKDKLKAMECYKGEIREFPHPRSIKILESYALRWGSVSGFKAAEAFELIREIKE